jgi:putative ATP-binding cassette transporter
VKNLKSTLAAVWRIATPYFRSEDKLAAWSLLATVIAIELVMVGFSYVFNWWQGVFLNGLQNYDWNVFVWAIAIFCGLAAAYTAVQVARIYINQWLQIRWRRWLTQHYLGEWLQNANHYRMQLTGDAADNPDQRITDDVRDFVTTTLSIGTGLLNSVGTLIAFVYLLWSLSATAPLTLFGSQWNIPGYLVWGALFYSIFGTIFTHLIGKPLVGLNFLRQQYEADFRFNLVRVRENSEQIALLEGDQAERQRNLGLFGRVVGNWFELMQRTKKLTAFTASYNQASTVFPYILAAPAYFAKMVQLGDLSRISDAFGQVQGSLSFFVSSYTDLAMWRSIVIRLEGFEANIAQAQALPQDPKTLKLAAQPGQNGVGLSHVALTLPSGEPLISADGLTLKSGERALITGPSGSGKSTLFRAIGGIWPFGNGGVSVPGDATMMILPQRPYFPVGSLKAAIVYPSEDQSFSDAAVTQMLNDVGLPALASRLNDLGHWNRMLSLGEQQRLGIARALLHRPNYLFLDEATASLDEPSEAALYQLIEQRLPETAVISIGHRSTLNAFHNRNLDVVPTGKGFALQERT